MFCSKVPESLELSWNRPWGASRTAAVSPPWEGHDGDAWAPLPELARQHPSCTESCSEGERKMRGNNSGGEGGRAAEEALEKDGELNHIQTGRNRGGRAAKWAEFWWWGLRYGEWEHEDREIWRQSFCWSIRKQDELALILGHDVV